MLLTGYHGTNSIAADKILMTKCFKKSSGKKEWLGTGIYFYFEYNDALFWVNCENKTVLECLIEVEEENYLDMDTKEGQDIFSEVCEYVYQDKEKLKSAKYAQENQCAVCNLIWDLCSDVYVLAASFYTTPKTEHTLLDFRKKRKEFCVRDNKFITNIKKV